MIPFVGNIPAHKIEFTTVLKSKSKRMNQMIKLFFSILDNQIIIKIVLKPYYSILIRFSIYK